MANNIQKHSQELATQLWAIANELRGSMDSSKFKDYILGVIFYRYLSEKTESYMNDLLKDDGISYRDALKNEEYAPTVREWSIEHLGYIIEPKYLWASLIEDIKGAEFSIEHFEKAISALVASTIGQESEAAFDKLFDDMNLQNKDLGKEVSDRTSLISKVMLKINDITFNVDDAEMDVLGTSYMLLISLFASDAGKKGGEFFTPTCASKLLARLATVGLDEVKNVADSCAGSGSLLLEVQNHLLAKKVGHFYATEKNGSNYNLLRMNLLMHGVPYKKFSCYNADSIKTDNYYEEGEPILFDIQVENPPYSAKFDQNPKLLEDPRFSSCGVIAPQGKADLMFVESMVYHMADDGRIAVLLPSGALYRGKKRKNGTEEAEYSIRKHLINNLNVIDAIIGLPANMFHGAKLPVVVMILKKKRNGNADNILFIDASKYFIPEKTMNIITDEDIDRIYQAYINRQEIERFSHVASLNEIRENDFNCNIPRYVDSFKHEAPVNIIEQNEIIKNCELKANVISTKIEKFYKELGMTDNASLTDKINLAQNILSGKVRFKNDNGEEFESWDELTIGDLFDKIRVTNKDGNNKNVITNSAVDGLIPQRDFFDKDIAVEGNTDKYTVINKGDFVYNPRKSTSAPYGPFNCYLLDEPGIVSPLYSCLKPKNPEYTPFLLYYFASPAWYSYIYHNGNQGGARHDRVGMTDNLLMGIPVLLPCIEEQKRIVEFFDLIDRQIQIEKEKLEAMKLIKKGMLQQMFA